MTFTERPSVGIQTFFKSAFIEGLDDTGRACCSAYLCLPQARNRRRWEAQATSFWCFNPQYGQLLIRELIKRSSEHEQLRFCSIIHKASQEALRLEGVRYHGDVEEFRASTGTTAIWTRAGVTGAAAGLPQPGLGLVLGSGGQR